MAPHGDLISWFTHPISLVDVCNPVPFPKRKESDCTIHGKYASFIQVPFGYSTLQAGDVVMHESDLPFTKS